MVEAFIAVAVAVFLLFTIGTVWAVRRLFGDGGGSNTSTRARQSKGARDSRE